MRPRKPSKQQVKRAELIVKKLNEIIDLCIGLKAKGVHIYNIGTEADSLLHPAEAVVFNLKRRRGGVG